MSEPRRERLSMDAGWRFAFGHAADPTLDFKFGIDHGMFSKTGASAGVRSATFDDTAWRLLDLPNDWAVELPFDDMSVFHHGYKPVGRGNPSTTIGCRTGCRPRQRGCRRAPHRSGASGVEPKRIAKGGKADDNACTAIYPGFGGVA